MAKINPFTQNKCKEDNTWSSHCIRLWSQTHTQKIGFGPKFRYKNRKCKTYKQCHNKKKSPRRGPQLGGFRAIQSPDSQADSPGQNADRSPQIDSHMTGNRCELDECGTETLRWTTQEAKGRLQSWNPSGGQAGARGTRDCCTGDDYRNTGGKGDRCISIYLHQKIKGLILQH